MAATDEAGDPLSRSIFGLRPYKTDQEAFSEDVAPRASGAANRDPLGGSLWATKRGPIRALEIEDDPGPAPSKSGDFSRGFGIAGKQLKQTAYGTAALIGDTFGADSLKDWGLKGYKEAEKEIQAVSKPSDSFTTALDMGGGAVVDWLQNAAGYLTGQAVELGVATVAGGLIGGGIGAAASGPAAPVGAAGGAAAGAITGAVNKAAVQKGIRGAVSKMIDKEAALLTTKYVAERGMTKEVAERAAAEAAIKSVYGTIGATAANTFLNATQSLGSIYGEAVEEAAKNGEEYSLGRIWLAGIAATAVDTWADSRAVKGLTDAFKGRNRASSIAIEAFKGGLREGLTEGSQTVIERWGADKDLATKEAFKEYIDSAAIGVLGGTTVGGVSGAVSKLQAPAEVGEDQAQPNITRLPTAEDRRETPVDFDGNKLQMREDVEATLNRPDLMAALYMRGDETQRETIRRAVERAGLVNEFGAALQNPKALEAQNQIVEEFPDLLPNMVSGLDIFANTLPDRTFKVDQRTTGGTLEAERKAEEEAARQGTTPNPPVVEEPNDPAVVPKDELPARTGPQDNTRNAVITQFNEVGTQIFGMNPGSVQDAKFDWAMNQLVKTHGFSTADARAILTGELMPSQEQDANEGPADPPPQTPPNLGDQGALDEAVGNANEAVTAEQVAQAIQAGTELGRGGNAIVFDLPGTPYVVRVPKRSAAPTATDQVVEASDPFEGRNFGQPVFTVGNVQVLRRQEGFPAGLTNYKTLTQEQADEQYEQATISAAQMPQEAYDQFAADLKYLNDKGAAFDPSKSNNVLIDTQSGRFNLVDINQQKVPGYNNSFGDMVITLMGNTYAWRYKGSMDLSRDRQTIYQKALAAAKKSGLDVDAGSSVEYSRKLAGLSASQDANTTPPTPPKTESQKATEDLKDAAANLFDVLTDTLGTKKNITGPQYTTKDLPDALVKVMVALGKKGIVTFKDAVREAMKLIRASQKGWAPLADKVTPRMLRDAYNAAEIEGKDSPESVAAMTTEEMRALVSGEQAPAKPAQRIQAAPEGPAATLRSQTRAVKTGKGDQLVTNQNPINARQLYMSPQEVAENERRAEEERSGDREATRVRDLSDGDDFAGVTMVEIAEGGKGQKNPAASYYRQALRDARTLLSGRVANVAIEPGQKPAPTRLNQNLLEKMGFDIFKLRVLNDDGQYSALELRQMRRQEEEAAKREGRATRSVDGKLSVSKELQRIRSELNDNVRKIKARGQAKQTEAAEPAQQPVSSVAETRARLNIPPPEDRRGEPTLITKMRDSIERRIRLITNADFFKESVGRLQTQIAEIDARLKDLDEMEADGKTYRPKRGSDDERPGLWGYQDENAYDRFESGMVFDKATPKNVLVDLRRKLLDDLEQARQGSLRGQARLYRIGMDRLADYVVKRAEDAIRGGVDPELVRAAARPYLDGVRALREINVRQQEQEPAVDPVLEQANRELEEQGFLEGQRVAAGLLADFKARRITQRELESLESRGLREGDFTMGQLLEAYRSSGMSPRQGLYAGLKHFSTRISRQEYVRQQGGLVSAVDAWFLDMQQARKALGEDAFNDLYAESERDLLAGWLANRSQVLGRRRITEEMRESNDPRIAFRGFLFNRITLEEARNPDTIRDTTLRQTLKGLFSDLEEAWFQDVATAIRRRPSLSYDIVTEPVMSRQENRAFWGWVEGIKAGVAKQAQVMARAPYFEAIRDHRWLVAVRSPEGAPMLASTPKLDLDQTGLDQSLARKDGREGAMSEYERLYVQIVNGELDAMQRIMDERNRLNAMKAGMVDLETGEVITDELADQLASDSLESVQMNAQMSTPLDKYGNEMTQYGASIQGDARVVRTVEEAAARDAQTGGQANVSIDDLSSEEQIQEGAISEFELETQELLEGDSESDGEGGAEQGTAADQEEDSQAASGRNPPMSLEGDGEFPFRRGPAWNVVTGAFVQDAVNRLTAGWKNATNVVVLPNAQHLPEPLRSRVIEKLAGGGAKGLYHEGTVYLFSQHLTGDADIEFTLFHEAYGHLGMRAVLGNKFDQFLETAYRTRPDVKKAVDALVAEGMPKLEAIDEVLSDMAAENRNVSVVKQWVGKIISGLREIGLGRVADWLATMTDAEVASTLNAARDAARSGVMPAFNGAPSEVRFKTARMPYEIFANKAGKTTGYARYNPSTDTWVVFAATGADIKDGHTAVATQDYDEVVRAMRSAGKVEYRTRSGVFVDDKIVADLVAVPKLNDQGKYGILDKRSWSKWRRNAQISFQNEYLPVFEVVDYLASIGRLTDKIDVKTALTLYERRTGFLVEQFRKQYVEPIAKLVEQAGKLGVTKKDIDRYLAARHTKERNNAVAKINPGMQDGGSGLTYDEALKIIAQVESSPAARVMAEIARKTDMMGKEKIRYLMDTGMITKAAAEKLLQYDHYVNLSGERDADPDFDDPGQIAGGSKFNVKGKEKRAFGRGAGNEAENVLARTIQAYEAALIRGQKNLVAQKVLALFETNYDPSAVIINAQPRLRQLNPETGLVEEVIDENYMARKDVMVAKINGIPSTIEFKDNTRGSFAEAIHGMVVPRTSAPIMEAVGKVTRMLGALLTTYNPAFTLVNFVRDVQTMYIQAAADGRITKKMARDMIRVLPGAMKAAIHEASGGRYGKGADPEMLRVLREMQQQGGITYFADRLNLEEQVAKIDALLSGKKYPGQKKVEVLLGILEFGANVSEIAPRLAAYKVVSDNGFSKEQAATFSGEITVNFNMRGANREMRQLFLFFNPAVQGGYKIHQLWKSPDGRKKFYGMAAALTIFGMLTSYIGRAVSGEDDDGIDRLDKVPLYKRATSVVISADSVFGAPLPIPYGWNAFFALGVFMADTFQGKQPLSVTAGRVVKTAAEAFSPIGMGAMDAKSFETFMAKFVAPTVALPVVEFLANENRFGAPIRKEQSPFDFAKTPDAQSYFRGVSPISRGITETLTEMTSGNKYKAGGIDVNPATIDFLIQSYLPGLPSDLYKGASIGIRAAQGEEIKRAPWPVFDRFSARIPTGYDAGAYRRAAELVETAYKEYDNTRDQGRRAEIRKEYPRLGYAHAAIASTKQELRDIRQQIAALEERRMSDEARVQRRNQLLEREERVFKRAVKRLMQAGEPVREAMMANE